MSILRSLKIKNIKLRNKFIVLLSIPILALIITVFLTITTINTLTENKSEIYSSSSLTLNADRDMYQAYVAVQNLLIFDSQSKEYNESMDQFKENVDQIHERITMVKEFVMNIEELKNYQHSESKEKIEVHIDQFQKKLNAWIDLSNSVIESMETKLDGESANLIELSTRKVVDSYNIARNELNIIGEIIDDFADNRIQKDNKLKETSIRDIILVAILALVLVIFIGLVVIRAITAPIYKIVGDMKQLAQGDFTVNNSKYNGKDEIGQLVQAVNSMVVNLRDLFQKTSETSEQVAVSSEELTANAEQATQATNQINIAIQEVARGAETQGAGAEESARAMQELTIGIQRVAETASSVSAAAMGTQKEADLGNESIQKVIDQMNTIHESVDHSASVIKKLRERSNEIGEITRVITGIANQTNLLALNAAIEAARAGEHGQGFAVVASEVRKLAEQSKESSDQITNLIREIQRDTAFTVEVMEKGTQEVEVGMDVVQETGKGFRRILESIEQVAAQIQEVSAVSEEMSASVEQVHASIDEMAHIAKDSASNTQSVASASEEQMASIEEITSSISSLSAMADELRMNVGKFKI